MTMMKNKNNNNEIKILNFDAGSSAKVNTKKKWYPIDLNVEAPPSPDYSQDCGDGGDVAMGGVGDVEVEEGVNVVNSEILKAKKGKMPMICSEVGDAAVVVEGVNGVGVDEMMLRRQDDVANGSRLQRKRKRDFSEYYIPPGSRLCRGPKAVIRVESSYDYVEDGYRWRKYGKKAIKGSPNPRGYFRCATQGCNVRKQVERDIRNPRFVISTYEGKHKHPVPTSKFKFTNSTIAAAAALSIPIKTTSTATNNIPIFPPQQPSPMPFSLHHRYSNSHTTPITNNYLWRPNYYNFFNHANNTTRPHTSGLNFHHPYALAAPAAPTHHGPIIGGSVNRGLPPLDRAPDFLQLGGYGVKAAPAAQLPLN